MPATVTRRGALAMQVCVPVEYSDDDVNRFAEESNPCGTTHGWHICRDGDRLLGGDPERVVCQQREGHVHIMLHA